MLHGWQGVDCETGVALHMRNHKDCMIIRVDDQGSVMCTKIC